MCLLTMTLSACHEKKNTRNPTPIEKANVMAMNDSGSVLRNNSQFIEAITLHEQALQMAQKVGDSIGVVVAYNNLGTDMRRLGNQEEAMVYHLMALQEAEKMEGDTSYEARKNLVKSLNGLGNVHMNIGDWEEAEKSFRRALAGEQVLKSDLGLAINYANIGSIKKNRGDIDSAMYYYKLSMECNKRAGSTTGIGLCHTYFGEIAEIQGNYTKAIQEYRKAYDTLAVAGDDWHTLEPLLASARLNLECNNVEWAKGLIEIAYERATSIQSLEHQVEALRIKALIAEAEGNTPEALTCTKEANILNDSILTQDKLMEMQKMRINYEHERSSKDLAVLQGKYEYEREHKLMYLVMGLMALCVAIGAITIAVLYRRFQKQRRQAIEDNIQTIERNAKAQKELYANISHEFRTPLTIVNGLTERIEKDRLDEDEQQAALADIRKQSDMMLSLVDQLLQTARKMDGTVTVPWKTSNDKPDEDSTASVISSSATSEKSRGKGKFTVMVAEDNADIRAYLHNLLSDNYNVILTSDGEEALKVLSSTLPDLIVTDVTMPKVDGFGLLEQVKKQEDTCHIPIVIITARVDDEDRMRGLQLGADAYLKKPFNSKELMVLIETLITQRQQMMAAFTSMILQGQGISEEHTSDLSKEDLGFLKECHSHATALMNKQELSTDTLSNRMCMSYSQLNRKLKSATNMTVNNYIENIRIAKACRLLTTSYMNVGDIATACGFQDVSYFSRMFRKIMKMSPTQYRNLQKDNFEA